MKGSACWASSLEAVGPLQDCEQISDAAHQVLEDKKQLENKTAMRRLGHLHAAAVDIVGPAGKQAISGDIYGLKFASRYEKCKRQGPVCGKLVHTLAMPACKTSLRAVKSCLGDYALPEIGHNCDCDVCTASAI